MNKDTTNSSMSESMKRICEESRREEEFIKNLPELAKKLSGFFVDEFEKSYTENMKNATNGCERYFYEAINVICMGYSWDEFNSIRRYIATREKITPDIPRIDDILKTVDSPIFKFFGDIDPNIEWRQKLELEQANKISN